MTELSSEDSFGQFPWRIVCAEKRSSTGRILEVDSSKMYMTIIVSDAEDLEVAQEKKPPTSINAEQVKEMPWKNHYDRRTKFSSDPDEELFYGTQGGISKKDTREKISPKFPSAHDEQGDHDAPSEKEVLRQSHPGEVDGMESSMSPRQRLVSLTKFNTIKDIAIPDIAPCGHRTTTSSQTYLEDPWRCRRTMTAPQTDPVEFIDHVGSHVVGSYDEPEDRCVHKVLPPRAASADVIGGEEMRRSNTFEFSDHVGSHVAGSYDEPEDQCDHNAPPPRAVSPDVIGVERYGL